jgi:hypothetical protein
MIKIDEVIAETRTVAQAEGISFVELDRTDYTSKLRIMIVEGAFIQIYANESNDKLNLFASRYDN